jgi:phosphonate transport system permease protein
MSDIPVSLPDEPLPAKKRPPLRGRNVPPRKSLVPAPVAALLSAILPGLGQTLAGAVQRGVLIFLSFVSIAGLTYWRFNLAASRRAETAADIFSSAIRLQPLLLAILILFAAMYLWIIFDAFLIARRSTHNPALLMILIVVLFFGLGWQIGEINLLTFFSRAGEAGPALGRVMWPWARAVETPEEILTIAHEIESPCGDEPYPLNEPLEEEPYLLVDPQCGVPSEITGEQGTTFHLSGFNFDPQQRVEIWWADPIGNEFRQRQSGDTVTVDPNADGTFELDIIMPYRLVPPGADEGTQTWEVQARQLMSVGRPQPSTELLLAMEKMVETIIIGMMATLFGIIFAIPMSFLAARNLMRGSCLTQAIYYVTRTILNIVRSIEPLIWAIIAVIVVGLGPFAGILALSLHTLASLAKLYSESIESIDPGPIEAIQATGANWLQTIVFAVIPQIIPPFVSFTIYRWDINIRMSTIIGFVGGGGIGFLLAQWIRLLDYAAAGIAVWFIAITVAVLDYISAEIRERYV